MSQLDSTTKPSLATPAAAHLAANEGHEAALIDGSARVAEVVARFGDRIVDVAHLGPTGRGQRRARWLVGAGALAMLGGVSLFAFETAQPWESWTQAALEAEEAGLSAPTKPGLGTGALGLGLGLLGLVPFMLGGIRMREPNTESYAIGESPEARVTVSGEGLPDAGAFDLVRREGEQIVLRYTPQMAGTVSVGGRALDLASLPARDEGSHRAYTLPHGATARVQHGGMRFFVRAVDPAALKLNRAPMDRAYWASVGGVGAAALGLITMMNMMPEAGLSFAWEEDANDARYARYLLQMDEVRDEPVQDDEPTPNTERAGGEPGQRHVGDEGKAGDPKTQAPKGRMSIKKRAGTVPRLGRDFDPSARASEAGILGILAKQEGSFIASPYGGAFAAGDGEENVWGNLTGEYVASAHGNAGLGLVGHGKSGGGSARGLMGLGNTGLIGSREGSPNGRLGAVRFKKRKRLPPPAPRHGVEKSTGGIDRAVIRRVVRSRINEVRGCYNRALTRNPTLEGRVMIAFVIGGTGKVMSSVVTDNALRDEQVGRCIATAVKRMKFPRPPGGSAVTVHYPFVFRPQ